MMKNLIIEFCYRFREHRNRLSFSRSTGSSTVVELDVAETGMMPEIKHGRRCFIM